MQPKALRLAAYFLIAHYVLLTGLGLMGQGAQDYMRIAVTLALLVASVLALFKPKRRGWLMVLAYALYMVSPFVQVLWAMGSMPNMDATARTVTIVVFSVLHAPLVVALILVFKPGSFAAFRNPAALDAAAPAAKP